MKVTDFRIGNYIQDFECQPYIFQVEEISKYVGYELWVKYRKGSAKTKDPDPIAINKLWLEKLGFGQNLTGNAWWHKENDMFIIGEEDGKFYYSYFGGTSDEPIVEHTFQLDYVHRLQNLYHSVTGNELVVSNLHKTPCWWQLF